MKTNVCMQLYFACNQQMQFKCNSSARHRLQALCLHTGVSFGHPCWPPCRSLECHLVGCLIQVHLPSFWVTSVSPITSRDCMPKHVPFICCRSFAVSLPEPTSRKLAGVWLSPIGCVVFNLPFLGSFWRQKETHFIGPPYLAIFGHATPERNAVVGGRPISQVTLCAKQDLGWGL